VFAANNYSEIETVLANLLSVLILIGLVLVFGWLASRAWRSRRAIIKWPGTFLAGLLALLLAVITVTAVLGFYRMYARQSHPVSKVQVAMTAEQVARGQRLASMCIECHASSGNLPLDGSKGNMVEGGPPVGVFYAPNLTPAGPLKDWSDGEIIRAVREGVHKNGRPLLVMPSEGFYGMGDADVQALVAYLRSQPAVQRDLPEVQPNVLAALFVGSGMFQTSTQPPITEPRQTPQASVTPEYGAYLVGFSGCRDCHGKDLAGRTASGPTDPPSAPNLRDTAGTWQPTGFVQTFRTGVTPEGMHLNEMPWQDYNKAFDDSELMAIHAYIKSLGPVARQ
jgi:mono/diheme cytochrome c family protein